MLPSQRHCMLYGQIKEGSENMTQTQLENMVLDLQRQVKELASRPYTQRAEEAKAEAVNAVSAAEEAEKENAENLLSMVEAMLEMSMDIDELKGE